MRVNLVGNDPKYNDPVLGANITGGSWSTMMNFDMMSRAGAAGRIALSEAGAAMLGVSASDVVANDSRIFAKSGKSVSFADIVKSGKATKTFSPDELKAIVLKTPDQYTLIGQGPAADRHSVQGQRNGEIRHRTFLPGMVYGRVVTPPVRYGAKVTALTIPKLRRSPGFIQAVVVEDPTSTVTGWVVAVAKTYPEAIKAADALKVYLRQGPERQCLQRVDPRGGQALQSQAGGEIYFTRRRRGAGQSKAAKVLEAEYTTNINIHCPLEPMNAMAEFKDGKLHLYAGNQFMTRSTAIAAGAVGMKPEDVVIHQYWIGGGFGRKLDFRHVHPAGGRRESRGQAGQGHLLPSSMTC